MGDIKDLTSGEGINKLKELATSARICHFVTSLKNTPLRSRPMSVVDVDDEGNFWFLSRESTHKTIEINDDPDVQLFFSNSGSSEYLTVFGYAEVIKDRNTIEKVWTPVAKAWLTEGKDDPEATVIKVRAADAYYWDTKTNKVVQLMKIAAGAILGKTMDDGIEGNISL